MTSPSIDNAINILKQRFGDRLSTSESVRQHHSHTTTQIRSERPDAVIFAHSTEDVAVVVSVCQEHRCPVIPFGVGSSLEGHVNAPKGGISIDMNAMDKVLAVHEDDLDAVVQPGVTRALNTHLRDKGLFFPIDPGANASLGGMAATRASGTNAVRYGTMKDNILALEAVMADGTVIRTGSRAKKSAAGYDLTRLLIGSEGTLGIITELTVKLHGIPEAIAGGICSFPSVEAACNAVITTIQYGIPVARMELLDAVQVRACNQYSGLDLPEETLLLLEFHGTENGVREQSELFGDIAAEHTRMRSDGPQIPKSGVNSGRRGMMRSGQRCRFCPGRKGYRPMYACRSHGWRNVLRKPVRISRPPASSHLSSAMWGMAIFTRCRWRFPTTRRHGRKSRDFPNGFPSEPLPWAAPAPVSTASVRAR